MVSLKTYYQEKLHIMLYYAYVLSYGYTSRAGAILALTAPTEAFLCEHSANVYQIQFTSFKIRAIQDGVGETVLFDVGGGHPPQLIDSIPWPPRPGLARPIGVCFFGTFFTISTIWSSGGVFVGLFWSC